jgi:peptidoglycan hydrolase-like protein with peptidoglycan-binding domain
MFIRPTARCARSWSTGVAVAAALVAAPAATAAPDPATSWHGRAIERPEPARSVTQLAWPRGWSAGSVATGTGSLRASRRVRAVQRELRTRGYRVGRVDGRFGPRTRGAVTWFQIKHGLEPTGKVDAATLAELRARRDPRATLTRTAEPTPTPASALAAAPVSESSDVVGAVLLALILATTLALIALLWRRSPQAPPTELPRPPAVSRSVLGYIVVDPETAAARERVAAATTAIAAWCDVRDWRLERVIHDALRHPDDRPGLAYVMDRIGAGTTSGIVLSHLSDLADSAADLTRTLEWINDADAFVIAVDEWLDPDLPPGRFSAGALVDLDQRRRGRVGARGGDGFGAELYDVSELRARVVAMRERGTSLEAIADALNAAGVPTLRGGSLWRPSGVQVLVGYKPPPAREPMRGDG